MSFEIGLILMLAALLWVLPSFTRRGLFFANTVGLDFPVGAAAERIRKSYRMQVAIHCAIAVAMAVTGALLKRPLLEPLAILWLILGSGWAAFVGYRHTKPYAVAMSPVREASLSARQSMSPAELILMLLPFALIAGAALYANFYWTEMPARIATHYGFRGPDHWVNRTPRNVYGIVLIFASVCLMLMVCAWGSARGTRMIAAGGREAGEERKFKRLLMALMIVLEWLMALPPWLILFGATVDPHGWMGPAWPILVVGASVTAVGLGISMGQGGRRLPSTVRTIPSMEEPVGDRTPDSCWKWGLFYFNPNDPAVFVEKRFGIGYTVNFANTLGWAFLSLAAVPVALSIFVLD